MQIAFSVALGYLVSVIFALLTYKDVIDVITSVLLEELNIVDITMVTALANFNFSVFFPESCKKYI